jgi:hypothetical protein
MLTQAQSEFKVLWCMKRVDQGGTTTQGTNQSDEAKDRKRKTNILSISNVVLQESMTLNHRSILDLKYPNACSLSWVQR